jgi:DNA-binding beta-propeller fold protein YncE
VNLHGPVRAAEVEGTAGLVISFEAWPEGKVAPTSHTLTVGAPRKGPKREPVSKRLVKTLPHPDRMATIGDVRFSADGTRLLMAGYPSGVVQVFDARTWKETARLDTPSGLRSSLRYANPTPDFKTILVDVRTRKLVRADRGGKVNERLQIDGRIDRYDARTGKWQDSIALSDRGPSGLFVLPGGKSAFVNTEGSFTAATATKRPVFAELVDLSSKTTRTLFDAHAHPAFAADGKTAYLATRRFLPKGAVKAALVKYDLAAGKVVKVVNAPEEQTFFDGVYLSPDGKWLISSRRRLTPPSVDLVILSPETLEEVARLGGPKDADRNTYFATPLFSADGKTMITRSGGPLLVWDLAGKKVVRTVPVGDLEFGRTALGPDGKRAVVVGMPRFDIKRVGRNPDPHDLPQPRVLLIDLADPRSEPEVHILPSGGVGGVALSPDGNTLAVGGAGAVHLLDVSARRK